MFVSNKKSKNFNSQTTTIQQLMQISHTICEKCVLMSLLIGLLTSCCHPFDCFPGYQIAIHSAWHTSLNTETLDDRACYRWWESFKDPQLTKLVEEGAVKNHDVRLAASQSREQLLETVNNVAANIAQSYLEWRAAQQRLKILQKSIALQRSALQIGQGLLEKGFIDSFNQNEYEANLNTLFAQKASIELIINKSVFHLSTILNDTPQQVQEALNSMYEPQLPCPIVLDCPEALVHRHPGIREAKKLYKKTGKKETFYLYQKKVLDVLEEIHNSLALLAFAAEKISFLENNEQLKKNSYSQMRDLLTHGQKDQIELLLSEQEYLTQQDLVIQAKLEWLTSYIYLYRALSLGWEIYYCQNLLT